MLYFLILPLLAFSGLAAEGTSSCPKCEMVREYNAAHPENHPYYYEDYLKEQEAKKAEGSQPQLACNCGNKKQVQEREDHLACGSCGDNKKQAQERENPLACSHCGGKNKKNKGEEELA